MKQQLAPILILFAAMLWGTTGTVQALAPDSAHPVAIGAARLFIGGLFYLLFYFCQASLIYQNPCQSNDYSSNMYWCVSAVIFSAVAITGVAIGTVVAIGSAPGCWQE